MGGRGGGIRLLSEPDRGCDVAEFEPEPCCDDQQTSIRAGKVRRDELPRLGEPSGTGQLRGGVGELIVRVCGGGWWRHRRW